MILKKIIIPLISCVIYYSVSFCQGTIRGKITDENGESVTGANIVLKSQPTVGTRSDFNGKFTLQITGSSPETIVISFISYQTMEETVNPKNGEVIVKNFRLVPVSVALQEAVIIGKANKAQEAVMEKIQIKSAPTISYISSEMIKKIGDTNISSAVTRVTGVSTNGSFLTVRGIGDRYMKTAINGSRIPTLDPFTNNVKLDLFPSSLVDNIVLVKTASPDLPGDWAGAYLSVETKDYPEKFTVNVETSFGYNQQTSLRDVVSSQRSATDWMGFDNGLRNINHDDFRPVYLNTNGTLVITPYEEFVALGLGDYYKSLGVTDDNWKQGTPLADTYYKLGLVQLGLLPANQINDPIAFSNAKSLYINNYQRHADDLVNEPGIQSQSKLFRNNWNTLTTRKAPLNFSQSFSVGNQIVLFGKPLGFLVGFRYASSIQYDPSSTGHRYPLDGSSPIGAAYDTLTLNTSKETDGWSALINLAYKYHPNHSISLLFMPNVIGVNNIKNGWNFDEAERSNSGTPGGSIIDMQYEERKQLVYQLKSEHYLPGPRLKIELDASYTQGNSSIPDHKFRRFGQLGLDRTYSYLKENLFDSRLSAELPIGESSAAGTRKLKFGAAYQYDYRKSDQYDYYLASRDTLLNGIVDSTLHNWYLNYGSDKDHNFGYSHVKAGFVMLDFPITPSLRFSGGIRVEQADIFSDVTYFNSLGLAANDLRRAEGGYIANPGTLNKISYLPSANLIVKLKRDELAPVNIRFSFSQTVARPSIREVSASRVYDYDLKSNVQGNPDLKLVQINNYDVRFEAYFKSGDNISVSAFYKDLKNHIELIIFDQNYNGFGTTWRNATNTWLKGIEIEGRKSMTKQLEIKANITAVNSRSTLDRFLNGSGDTITHVMYDQAPYIINGILAYTSDKMGISAALSYNVQGPRLVIVGKNARSYDIYEMPRNLLDFKASKTVGKHFSVSIKVQDILHTSIRRAYKFPGGYNLDYDKYTWGTSYVFAVSYKL